MTCVKHKPNFSIPGSKKVLPSNTATGCFYFYVFCIVVHVLPVRERVLSGTLASSHSPKTWLLIFFKLSFVVNVHGCLWCCSSVLPFAELATRPVCNFPLAQWLLKVWSRTPPKYFTLVEKSNKTKKQIIVLHTVIYNRSNTKLLWTNEKLKNKHKEWSACVQIHKLFTLNSYSELLIWNIYVNLKQFVGDFVVLINSS